MLDVVQKVGGVGAGGRGRACVCAVRQILFHQQQQGVSQISSSFFPFSGFLCSPPTSSSSPFSAFSSSSSSSSLFRASTPLWYKSSHQPSVAASAAVSSASPARGEGRTVNLAAALRGSSCSEDKGGPLPPRDLTPLQKRQLQMQNKAIFTLTPPALHRVRYLISQFASSTSSSSSLNGNEKSPTPSGIRIGVRRRGCSGYSYTVNYYFDPVKEEGKTREEPFPHPSNSTAGGVRGGNGNRVWNPFEEDTVVEQEGLKVVVAADALFYVIGTVMDYTISNVEEKFLFRNPNKKYSCGCEESFMPYDSEDLDED